MNTNKYEFDSTDEMLNLYDFHFDQNVPVQGPEAQGLEDQAPEDQAPEALQLAAHSSVMPSTAQLQEGKSSADINFDQNHPDQAPSVGTSDGPVVTEGSDDSSQAIDQLLKVGMSRADAEEAMRDKTLNKIALSNPKSVKRKWAHRQSVVRSKKRKAENQAKLETRIKTLQTQRTALVDREALCKKDVDALQDENTKLRSMVRDIQQQKHLLDLQNANLRIKAGQVDPNSGPPGMMIPFGVPHNNYTLNGGPPGMMMPFGVHQNNFSLNPYQQEAQARANVASGEGADATGSDAGGGDDAPGQGP